MPTLLQADDLAVCNCSECNATLHGERQRAGFLAGRYVTSADLPEPVAGRIAGRPYCAACWFMLTGRDGEALTFLDQRVGVLNEPR